MMIIDINRIAHGLTGALNKSFWKTANIITLTSVFLKKKKKLSTGEIPPSHELKKLKKALEMLGAKIHFP